MYTKKQQLNEKPVGKREIHAGVMLVSRLAVELTRLSHAVLETLPAGFGSSCGVISARITNVILGRWS